MPKKIKNLVASFFTLGFCAVCTGLFAYYRYPLGTTPNRCFDSKVSLSGIHLGDSRLDVKSRNVEAGYGYLYNLEFDSDDRVIWVDGRGVLETPKGTLEPPDSLDRDGCTEGFPSRNFERAIRKLGPPNFIETSGMMKCWVYSDWNVKIHFSQDSFRVELDRRSGGVRLF